MIKRTIKDQTNSQEWITVSNYIFEREDNGLVKLCEQYNLTLKANLTLQTSTLLQCFENSRTTVTPLKNIINKLAASLVTFSYYTANHAKICSVMEPCFHIWFDCLA